MKKKIIISIIVLMALATTAYGIKVKKSIEQKALAVLPVTHIEQIIEQKNIDQKVATKSTAPIQAITSFQVPILVYHSILTYYPGESAEKKIYDVEPAVFEQQMQFLLDNGYKSISYADLTDNFLNNKPIPEKSFIINFDDGRQNQYDNALPILKKLGLTATFFIYTNPIERNVSFMTWPEIKALDAAGMTIGGHTRTHPFLAKITDINEMRKEVEGGKKILEEKIGKPVDFFAYPFYQYSDAAIAMVKEAGYKAARGGWHSGLNSSANLYTLGAIQISNDLKDFKSRVCQTMPKGSRPLECRSKS